MPASMHRSHGFTLIELMVTVAIAVILMSAAAPSFSEFQRNAELTSTANQVVAAISAARGEAMKRGTNAMVLATGSTWAGGWRVFVDVNRDNAFTEGTDVLIHSVAALPSYLTTTGSGAAAASPLHLLFDASGYSREIGAGFSASTIEIARNDVADAAVPAQTRRIKISTAGRVRVCKPASALDTGCALTGD